MSKKLTANQRYKESGSDMSFKEWLKTEQDKGVLADHEKMFNADGLDEPKPTIKKAKNSMLGLNMLGIVALGSLVYGLRQVSKANVE